MINLAIFSNNEKNLVRTDIHKPVSFTCISLKGYKSIHPVLLVCYMIQYGAGLGTLQNFKLTKVFLNLKVII